MSRVGKRPIELPKGVTVSVAGSTVTVKGPKGTLETVVPASVSAKVEGNQLVFERAGEDRVARANHGLARALARNAVVGVSEGFTRRLEIQGVGYRAEVKGKNLVLSLGYSHPIEVPIPADIQISVDKDNKITIGGISRDRVGQVAANLRSYRTPDRYKGKGVRYEGEHVALKEGKSA
jgi:large subunit ribosomal protein L6